MNNQRGITLIGAIFVLIIVSLLGQYLVTIAGVQRQTSLLSLQSSRAYQAANAGVEWSIASVIANNTCPTSPPSNFTGLTGFTVTTLCNNLGSFDENGIIQNIYQISATSQFSSYGQVDYVSRKLEVIIHDE
ncbi:MAG: pilus assembly protein MshP [Methylophaga sp.]|nr:pilus assembly protein MshP [Methylophaga sp.]